MEPQAAIQAWLVECRLDRHRFQHWWVDLFVDAAGDALLELRVAPDEWAIAFRHGAKVSELRVTVHDCDRGRDDHGVLDEILDLSRFGAFLGYLEARYQIMFRRHAARVRSNLPDAAGAVGQWLCRI